MFLNIKRIWYTPELCRSYAYCRGNYSDSWNPGNGEVFKTQLENIPEDYLSAIPEDITGEIIKLADGEFRTETADAFSAENETNPTEVTSEASKKQSSEAENINKTEQKKKIKTSSVLLFAGIILISCGSIAEGLFKDQKKDDGKMILT